jgi:uncharacterized protein (DUF302 family)
VRRVEAATGDVSDGVLAREMAAAKDAKDFERRMQGFAADTGFMRFLTPDHGALLTLFGQAVKAKFYAVGNPLLAMTMLKHDTGAALNVPVRLLIYETRDGAVRVGYDLLRRL